MKTEYDVFYVSGRLAIVDREIKKFKTFLNGKYDDNDHFAKSDQWSRELMTFAIYTICHEYTRMGAKCIVDFFLQMIFFFISKKEYQNLDDKTIPGIKHPWGNWWGI